MAPSKSPMGYMANRLGSAAKKASGAMANCVPTAVKRVADRVAMGGIVGAVVPGAVAASEGLVLNGLGFTAVGPAAGSCAAAWMSGIATANGVGVTAGSWYAAAQAAAMGGGALLGAPFVIGACATCAVVGAVTVAVVQFKRGEGGDAPGTDDSTRVELSAELDDATEPEQSVALHPDDEFFGK